MEYKLGTGDADNGYKNDKLTKGYYYSTFLRAYVRQVWTGFLMHLFKFNRTGGKEDHSVVFSWTSNSSWAKRHIVGFRNLPQHSNWAPVILKFRALTTSSVCLLFYVKAMQQLEFWIYCTCWEWDKGTFENHFID